MSQLKAAVGLPASAWPLQIPFVDTARRLSFERVSWVLSQERAGKAFVRRHHKTGRPMAASEIRGRMLLTASNSVPVAVGSRTVFRGHRWPLEKRYRGWWEHRREASPAA